MGWSKWVSNIHLLTRHHLPEVTLTTPQRDEHAHVRISVAGCVRATCSLIHRVVPDSDIMHNLIAEYKRNCNVASDRWLWDVLGV
jgi:hypothetical protein